MPVMIAMFAGAAVVMITLAIPLIRQRTVGLALAAVAIVGTLVMLVAAWRRANRLLVKRQQGH